MEGTTELQESAFIRLEREYLVVGFPTLVGNPIVILVHTSGQGQGQGEGFLTGSPEK